MVHVRQLFALFSVLVFLAYPAFPQKSSAIPKEESLYFKALSVSIIEMEKSWGHIDDSDRGSAVRTDYHHMVVLKDSGISDELPEQFRDYHVEYLDTDQLIARCKKVRKELSVLRIGPLESDGASLKASISVSWASYKGRSLYLGLEGGSEVTFRFDCETQRFVVSNIRLWGV